MLRASLVAQKVKKPAMQVIQVQSLSWQDTLEKEMATLLPGELFLPGDSHGQRSLVGYSPWGHKESTQLSDKHTVN